MNELAISEIAAVCVFAGGVGGLLFSSLLPTHHLTTDTRDTVRLGIGVISVLASLVLGLLTASAKGTFDSADQQVRAYAADLILLDETLRDYGAAADPIRAMLVQYTGQAVRTTWPDVASAPATPLESKASGELLDHVLRAILTLSPTTDNERWLHTLALQIAARLIHTRWSLLIGQEGTINPVMLGIMVTWIVIIFASFGLYAPRNTTVVAAFFLCAMAIGASIFVILEMDTPFNGVIMISGAPMQNALAHLSQ